MSNEARKSALVPTWGRLWSYIELGHDTTPGKIDTYLEVFTTWRGVLVRAEFKFHQYTYQHYTDTGERSNRLSDLCGYVHTAGAVDSMDQHYSSDLLTDTARQRITEAFGAEALERVKAADDSRASAIIYAMRDRLEKAYDPANEYARFVSAYRDDLTITGAAHDVLRAYRDALIVAGVARESVTEYARELGAN